MDSAERTAILSALPEHEQLQLLHLVEEFQTRSRIERGRTDFMSYVQAVWDIFIPGEHHKIMADAFNRIARGELKRLIINMPPRHCLAVNTPIPTPDGWTTMAEIRPGDRVCRPDGSESRVVGKSELHRGRQVWKAITNDGAEPIVCDAGHIWHGRLGDTHHAANWTTQQVIDSGYVLHLPEVVVPDTDGTIMICNRSVTFEPAGYADVQCIEIEHPDGLFLAGKDYIVQHNTKSEFTSWLLPAWLLGLDPSLKIIQAMHTQDLSVDFGRKVRDLVNTSTAFREIFPELHLKSDVKSAGKWASSKGGQYFAAGVGGALAGRGADLCIIDDPISEQDTTDSAFEQCWEWFMSGPRQRLQPGGTIIIVMTRWSKADLAGKLIKRMKTDAFAEKYEVIDFPAINVDPETGEDISSLWPEYWPLEAMQGVRANISPHMWNAQYMQNPTGKGSVIIPADKIKRWPYSQSPALSFMLQSYDLAYSKSERADPSAGMTFGVFYPEGEINGEWYDGTQAHIIGLDLLNEKLDFPDLKQEVRRRYLSREPDEVLIEAKATGLPLAQELRRSGIPITTYTPSRGTGDKITRLNSVSSIVYEGRFWLPDGPMWAEEVIEQLSSFPQSEHDDIVDVVAQALIRFRRGSMIRLQSDEWGETTEDRPTKKKRYYRV